MIIVSDTSPITNLAAIPTLDLLQFLYGSIIIPVAVYNELTQISSAKEVPGATEVKTYSWIQTRQVQNLQKVNEILVTSSNIHLGEVEAIMLAIELNADLLLMDERRGRALAIIMVMKRRSRYGKTIFALPAVTLPTNGATSKLTNPTIDCYANALKKNNIIHSYPPFSKTGLFQSWSEIR